MLFALYSMRIQYFNARVRAYKITKSATRTYRAVFTLRIFYALLIQYRRKF